MGIIAKFLEGGNALGGMSIIKKKKSKFLFFHQFLAIFQLIFVLDFLQRGGLGQGRKRKLVRGE